jgi:hypothetical protein
MTFSSRATVGPSAIEVARSPRIIGAFSFCSELQRMGSMERTVCTGALRVTPSVQ